MTSIQIDRTDGLSSSVAIKGPCRVATTANITLAGQQTIDGVAVVADDRVLVKNQTTASENGIYVVDTGAWRRAKDFSRTNDVKSGTQVLVFSGTVNSSTQFMLSTVGDILIGTTNLTFEQSSIGYSDLSEMAILVETRTALKAVDTTQQTVAILKESGREGTFVWRSGDYSTQIAADTAEGVYIKATAIAATAGAWVRMYTGLADVRWFGAQLNDATDDTAAFNAALAIAKYVWFPEGRAYVTDRISVPNGGILQGVNVEKSVFSIKSDFNLAATGVVKIGTSENTGIIDGFGFEFYQPASSVRANMIQYPAAVDHASTPRARIGHIRISRGWNGINAGGNAGGATYDWIECGTLNVGLQIDGALDTMNIGRFRVWPFGMSVAADVGLVYLDGNTIGIGIGRCDGLAGEVHMYGARAEFSLGAGASASRHLTSLHLDGDSARLRVLDGPLDIDFVYTTKSAADTGQSILLDGAGNPVVRIANLQAAVSNQVQPSILVNAGQLTINGGRFQHTYPYIRGMLVQNTAILSVRNMELVPNPLMTEPFVGSFGAGTTLNAQDNYVSEATGTGPVIKIETAGAKGTISNNNVQSYAVVNNSFVSKCDAFAAYTPTFAAGSGSLTTTTGISGQFAKFGGLVAFEAKATITTNGTGATSLTFTLPVACAVATAVAAVDDAGLALSGVISAGSSVVTIKSATGTYPGANGKSYFVSGTYKAT